ncbi:hypothetical protein HaLaN_17364, partial [Haematococcus lacustris]
MAEQPWARWLDIKPLMLGTLDISVEDISKPECYGAVAVCDLHGVTAADVLALAPLCRDCTHFELCCGSLMPSLEFWRQLVQLMPAAKEVAFFDAKDFVSEAMHQSLQLMADQPWARAAGQQQSVQGPADSSAAAPCCLDPWGCCLADGATGSKGKMLQAPELSSCLAGLVGGGGGWF